MMAGNLTLPWIGRCSSLRSVGYFKTAFPLSVGDFEYICKTNTVDLSSWLALIMAELIFSDISQFVILATREGGADVAERVLLAAVTRWARSIFLMISSFKNRAYFSRFRLLASFLCHPMSSQTLLLMFMNTIVFSRLLSL